ncbi:caspase domain-containing protein [Amycolatopsis sp. NPDC052450]|uniref:caspase domain-containing protein n=1 Tax=Amycolatopsis sp. NPDC052450 TaxID=3363937 RepID=UPI0037C787DB
MLVGTSVYAHETYLHSLPAVDNNLTDLATVLTDPTIFGLQGARCVPVRNAPDALSVARALRQYAMATTDTLVVYFAGHGLLAHNNELYLSLSGTDPDELQTSAFRYQLLREILANSPATHRILILDCCFSGRATETLSNSPSLNIAGTYVLAATPSTEMALAPPGQRNTAFTGALLHLLRNGIPGGREELTLGHIYSHLWTALNEQGLPLPQHLDTGHTYNVPMFHNTAAGGCEGDQARHFLNPSPHHDQSKPRRLSRGMRIALAITVVVALGSGIIYTLAERTDTPSQTPAAGTSAPPVAGSSASNAAEVSPTPSPTITSAPNKQAPDSTLVVRSTWPTARVCDGGTAVAMPPKGPSIESFPAGAADMREQATARGGAFYLSGYIYLFLSAISGKTVDILDITPSFKPPTHEKAAWIYSPQGGCGGLGNRVFDFDLDAKKLVDKGVVSGVDGSLDPNNNPDAKLVRDEPLGPGFGVSQDKPGLIRIDAHGCKANYTFSLNISYAIAGETTVHVQTFGPFRSNASSGDVPVYAPASTDGENWQFVKTGIAEQYYKC